MTGGGGNKSWFSSPTNRTTALFYALMAFGIFWFWGLILPFLLSAALGTLELIKVCAVIGGILWLVTSERVRFIAKVINRKFTGWFVAIDPIGIRVQHIADTKSKKEELDAATGEIRGLRIKLGQRLNANRDVYDHSMRDLQSAQQILVQNPSPDRKRMAERIISSESKHSSGLENLINKQSDHMKHYDMVLTVLTRYGEVCDDFIKDLQNEVDLQKQDLEESRGFAKGMKAAFGIFKGSGVDLEMDEMARQQIEDQYSARMGEVENFLNLTKNVIEKADFNDETALADVQSRLDRWSGQNLGAPVGKGGTTKQQMLTGSTPMITVSSVLNPTSNPVSNKDTEDYFK